MKDIAFHITDVAENSIRAGATRIDIGMSLDAGVLCLSIADNGCGMDEATLRKVTNPFYTTRTTRRMGLGLPFLFQSAEQCGGRAEVHSEQGKGTQVQAWFPLNHIDCPPAGDLATTFMLLIVGNPPIDIAVTLANSETKFSLSTHEVAEALGDLPLGHPQAASILREIFAGNTAELFGTSLL